MSFKNIRAVQQQIWPMVRDSIDRVRDSRKAVEANPAGATSAALTRARKPWNKVVMEETVWAIAKSDLLITPEERTVLDRAIEWAESWDKADGPPDEMDAQEDCDLHLAVQELLTSQESGTTVNLTA